MVGIITLVVIIGCIFLTKKVMMPYFVNLVESSENRKVSNLAIKSNFNVIDINTCLIETVKIESNKPVIIHFWATWCSPCIREMYLIQKHIKSFDNYFKIYFLSTEDSETQRIFLQKHRFDFNFFAVDSKIAQQLPFNILPTTYVVKNGYIKFKIWCIG
ncbi:MAG: TlpA family protein disulfide reductase [Saprospiraceae bacterium]|nr:TlpA family protein disulfide reductase [Saprospiraceae bacterium]